MGGREADRMGRGSKERHIHFPGLGRRQLQRLCKKHGIPANKSSAFLLEALSKLFPSGPTLPPETPGPGLHSCKAHQPSVLQLATASVSAWRSEACPERVYKGSHTGEIIDQKFRVKKENGESGAWVFCKAKTSHPSGTMAGRNSQATDKEPQACNMWKVKEEHGEDLGPTNPEGWGLLHDACNDFDDDPFDGPFARLEGFTPSMEAMFASEDDGTEVVQALRMNQDTDAQHAAERAKVIEVQDSVKKPCCSPGQINILEAAAPFLEKVVTVKESSIKEELAAGEKLQLSGSETAELNGATQESCISEDGDTETTDVIDTAKGSHLHLTPGKASCQGVLGTRSAGKQSNLSGTGLVDPQGKSCSRPEFSCHATGVKRRFSVVEDSSQVCFEPPRAVPTSSMLPVSESQNLEYFVERPEGISLTVDLNQKCSPGSALLQYFQRVEAMSCGSAGGMRPVSSVRVTRISSILDLALGKVLSRGNKQQVA